MSSIVGYLTFVPDDGESFDCERTSFPITDVVTSSTVTVSARLIVGIRMVSVLSHFQQRIADVGHPSAGEPPADPKPARHALGPSDRKSSAERRLFLVIDGAYLS